MFLLLTRTYIVHTLTVQGKSWRRIFLLMETMRIMRYTFYWFPAALKIGLIFPLASMHAHVPLASAPKKNFQKLFAQILSIYSFVIIALSSVNGVFASAAFPAF